ncbi:hypothetical protein UlMin_038631 [Ulmus minor]
MAATLRSALFLAFLLVSAINAQETFPNSASSISQPPLSPLSSPQELQDQNSFFSHIALLPQILSQLGFHELATAAPSLSDSTAAAWIGPSTLFAPTDASLRSCLSCSVPNLLREHIVPGLFTIDYLRKLAFGTKIETLSPGRCITVTSEMLDSNLTAATAPSKVFIGGVEITRPDLFNNGLVVVHGLQGFIAPLSPFSCDVERMASLSFPFHPDQRTNSRLPPSVQPAIMRLMLRDAMLRLRNNGFSILALAFKVKYAELVNLSNMTVFALDDISIFSGSHSYINNVRFHIVPNHLLTVSDLEKLPVGTPLPTLEQGQSLVITTSGVGQSSAPMRINYVRIRVPEVIRNLKIVVHSLFLPFPHIHPVHAVYDEILGGGGGNIGGLGGGAANLEGHFVPDQMQTQEGTCYSLHLNGGNCVEVPMPPVKPVVDIEDHHGL